MTTTDNNGSLLDLVTAGKPVTVVHEVSIPWKAALTMVAIVIAIPVAKKLFGIK